MFCKIAAWACPCPEAAYFCRAKGNSIQFIRLWGSSDSGNANYCTSRKWSNCKSRFKAHFPSVPGSVSFQMNVLLISLHFVLETACLKAKWRWTCVLLVYGASQEVCSRFNSLFLGELLFVEVEAKWHFPGKAEGVGGGPPSGVRGEGWLFSWPLLLLTYLNSFRVLWPTRQILPSGSSDHGWFVLAGMRWKAVPAKVSCFLLFVSICTKCSTHLSSTPLCSLLVLLLFKLPSFSLSTEEAIWKMYLFLRIYISWLVALIRNNDLMEQVKMIRWVNCEIQTAKSSVLPPAVISGKESVELR